MNKIQGCALLITVVIILLVNIIYGLKPEKKRFKEGDTNVVNIDDKGIIPKNIFKTGIDDYNKINKHGTIINTNINFRKCFWFYRFKRRFCFIFIRNR